MTKPNEREKELAKELVNWLYDLPPKDFNYTGLERFLSSYRVEIVEEVATMVDDKSPDYACNLTPLADEIRGMGFL